MGNSAGTYFSLTTSPAQLRKTGPMMWPCLRGVVADCSNGILRVRHYWLVVRASGLLGHPRELDSGDASCYSCISRSLVAFCATTLIAVTVLASTTTRKYIPLSWFATTIIGTPVMGTFQFHGTQATGSSGPQAHVVIESLFGVVHRSGSSLQYLLGRGYLGKPKKVFLNFVNVHQNYNPVVVTCTVCVYNVCL